MSTSRKKRFTFADAKERIAELEETVADLQDMLKEEIDSALDDVKEDTRDFGWGDLVFVLGGLAMGLLLGYFLF